MSLPHCVILLLVVVAATAEDFHLTETAQQKAVQLFSSPCQPVSDSTPKKPWSSKSSWPNGVIPGVGTKMGSDITIPCGESFLLDVKAVTLGTLAIKGMLTFKDDKKLPQVLLRAKYVIVEGKLQIGTSSKQFSHTAIIELLPSPGQQNYMFPSSPPQNLGHKAFVVIGGSVSLHGLPGPESMPVWCRLNKNAKAGDTSISVDCDASHWPAGFKIALASTDFDRTQTEVLVVKKVSKQGSGSTIRLKKGLKHPHFGNPKGLSDGFGGFLDQRAEVALLTRNIRVTAIPEGLIGGHFMIYKTDSSAQVVEGVQFTNMGQQGTLGRYPIHFHVSGNLRGTICRKNTIQDSFQRCVVVHASHDILIDSNVAFNTSGHCFMNEEGGERNNTFTGNLGMLTRGVTKVIPRPLNTSPTENDNSAATFWMTNALNTFTGNVAAGSSDSGFWFDMTHTVLGDSLSIPGIESIQPMYTYPTAFSDNVAHSNHNHGFRTYPEGMRPRTPPAYTPAGPGVILRFNAYKNGQDGMFIHNSDRLVLRDCTFADNPWGVQLDQDAQISIEGSRFVGSSTASGSFCPNFPTFGVVIDQSRSIDFKQSIPANDLRSVSFYNYQSSCSVVAAAIALTGLGSDNDGDFWNPSHNSQGLKLRNTQPIWMAPRNNQFQNPFSGGNDGGETALFYTFYDKDGSLQGSPGYLVANNPLIIPPSGSGCRLHASWNAYACAGVCYRTVKFSYPEQGFSNSGSNSPADFSSLRVRRSDGTEMTLAGNLHSKNGPSIPGFREFFFTVLASDEYSLQIMSPSSGKPFSTGQMRLQYADAGECARGLTLSFAQNSNQPWIVKQSKSIGLKSCPGSTYSASAESNAQIQNVCSKSSSQSRLKVFLNKVFTSTVYISQSHNPISCATSICGLVRSGATGWQYDASGGDHRRSFLADSTDLSLKTSTGAAPFGRSNWDLSSIKTVLPGPSTGIVTYYFKHPFWIERPNCYSSLILNIVVHDGLLVFLNGQEAFRANLPEGPILPDTLAVSRSGFMRWQKIVLPLSSQHAYYLLSGQNVVTVEYHASSKFNSQMSFDLRMLAQRRQSCDV